MHRDDLPMEQRLTRDEATAWLARPGRGHDCVKRAFDRLFRRPPGAEPEPWRCVPDPDERVLCGSCMTPNHPAAGFCEQCGKPLGFLSCMGPFERIWAQGWVYRQLTFGRVGRLHVIGAFLLFLPPVVGSVAILFFVFRSELFALRPLSLLSIAMGQLHLLPRQGLTAALAAHVFLLYVAFDVVFLYRVVCNYQRNQERGDEGTATTAEQSAPPGG